VGAARAWAARIKGLIEFGGEPLIAHVLRRLQPQVSEILISANRNIGEYARLGASRDIRRHRHPPTRIIPDRLAGVLKRADPCAQ